MKAVQRERAIIASATAISPEYSRGAAPPRDRMRILLINLDRQPERLRDMRSQLDGLGLRYERVAAIDRYALTSADLRAHGTMTPGELACARSHFACWTRALECGDDHVLILEDDVLLAPQLADVLAAHAPLPADAHLVRFETRRQPVQLDNHDHAYSDGITLRRLYSAHPGTAGYVITRKGAERLLAERWRYDFALDGALFEPKSALFHELAVYQCDPGLVIQADVLETGALPAYLRSDLEHERTARKARRIAGALPYSLDKLDSFAKDVRKFVQHRCLSRLRGRHMRRIEFAGTNRCTPVATAAE